MGEPEYRGEKNTQFRFSDGRVENCSRNAVTNIVCVRTILPAILTYCVMAVLHDTRPID